MPRPGEHCARRVDRCAGPTDEVQCAVVDLATGVVHVEVDRRELHSALTLLAPHPSRFAARCETLRSQESRVPCRIWQMWPDEAAWQSS
jgi:hypothetical protein